MKHRARLSGALVVVVTLVAARARAQDAGTTALASTDFALTLSRVTGSTTTPLTSAELATYFSIARCACPTNVLASVSIDSTAAANLGASTVDAQLEVGSDCDDVAVAGCTAVGGALSLSATQQTTSETVSTSTIFSAGGDAACAPTASVGTRLWAIVRLDGQRLATEPSVALTLGGAGPTAPTAVTVKSADDGLLVSWTASGDATTLQGHQVFCSPAPAAASAPSYDTCPAALPDGGTSPFATLDAKFLCSGLVAIGNSSTRVEGLTNGQAYEIAVVAVGIDGTPSAPSTTATGAPGPTYGFEDLYQRDGGTAASGCDLGGGSRRGVWAAVLAAALSIAVRLRRRRRATRTLLVFVAFAWPGARVAHAQMDGDSILAAPASGDASTEHSPHNWNFELRFGPYRPDVDSEFADRGSPARPYQETFGSSSHLMWGVEIDRQVFHRGGTWAVGVGVGHYVVSAAALAADMKTRSGDETSLRLIPVSASLVYRADLLHDRYHSPLVPYAKLGLDCSFWEASDTAEPATDGKTFGWHAAVGVSFDLSIFDPDDALTMDRETGVNQTALFFEGTRDSLAGFGSGSALHVGDTTWFAGLMLEL